MYPFKFNSVIACGIVHSGGGFLKVTSNLGLFHFAQHRSKMCVCILSQYLFFYVGKIIYWVCNLGKWAGLIDWVPVGGQNNLLGGQVPTHLNFYLPPCGMGSNWEYLDLPHRYRGGRYKTLGHLDARMGLNFGVFGFFK